MPGATSALDIPALIHDAQGFVRTLGPRVLSVEPARLRLDADPELLDHLGGPHAAASFGLGDADDVETAAATYVRALRAG